MEQLRKTYKDLRKNVMYGRTTYRARKNDEKKTFIDERYPTLCYLPSPRISR